MNWLDAAIIAVIIWFTLSAFQAGFVRESVTIMGAVLGVVLAGIFYTDLANGALTFIHSDTLAHIVAFAIIFGVTALAGQVLALVLKPTVNLLQLGVFDQLAGAAFGFLKAMVFIQVFLILFVTYPKWHMDKTINNSVFGSLIIDKTAVLTKILPHEFEAKVNDFTSKLSASHPNAPTT